MVDETRLTLKSNALFLAFFGLYTAGSIFLLLLGAGAAVATYFNRGDRAQTLSVCWRAPSPKVHG